MAARPCAPLPKAQWPAGASLDDFQVQALHRAQHHDPAGVLGWHGAGGGDPSLRVVRVWHPRLERDFEAEGRGAVLLHVAELPPVPLARRCAWLYEAVVALPPAAGKGGEGLRRPLPYAVAVPDGGPPLHDAFGFEGELLSQEQLDKLQSGFFPEVANSMGSHCAAVGGVWGLRFVVWAPRARFVSVVGDWNAWDGRASPMRRRCRHLGWGFTGVWELFVPFGTARGDVPSGSRYGYRIHTAQGTDLVRMDPFAQEFEVPSDLDRCPGTNTSVVSACDDDFREEPFGWRDAEWIAERDTRRMSDELLRQPMAIYEVHLPSWRRAPDGGLLGYRDIAPMLVQHVLAMHFNYVELVGLAHHPYIGSWGYQVAGYYACHSLLGSPDDLKFLVDSLHAEGVGVLMDFVPTHFCKDPCSFSDFDGSATFEYEDPREGEQREWGTKIFNFKKNEVRSFLLGSALFWARRYHIDGFRCDAVSCMIYRNFGRADGEWIPNEHGGDSNLEAVSLLRELNRHMNERHPGVLMIAEESTSWEGVTSLRDCSSNLGFDLKWDLGWMNDTLTYLSEPGWSRPSNHHKLTKRAALWMMKERYVLPLSHDEVANFKGSLLDKMGRKDGACFYDKLRLLCALYGLQVASPGRPLLFMGCEIGQGGEWDCRRSVDWHEGQEPLRQQLCTWVSDLMGVYLHHAPLHRGDDSPHDLQYFGGFSSVCGAPSFEWIEDNPSACVLAFVRHWRRERPVLAVVNLGNCEHRSYSFCAPYHGEWEVLLNSDDGRYGGRGVGPGNLSRIWTHQGGREDCSDSITFDVPAQGCVLLLGPEGFAERRTSGRRPVIAESGPSEDKYCDDAYEFGFTDDLWGF
mmetsp:Transcript_116874/g.342238  ORF Transcript_116874/g.342238 Transcript_116874/m.342238 type:complete len:854 (-) Transcript_116874:175-2736(-)